MTAEQLQKLGELIYARIKSDYERLYRLDIPREMLSEKILSLISDEDKEKLLSDLVAEKKAELEFDKTSQTASIDSQISSLDELIK